MLKALKGVRMWYVDVARIGRSSSSGSQPSHGISVGFCHAPIRRTQRRLNHHQPSMSSSRFSLPRLVLDMGDLEVLAALARSERPGSVSPIP